MKQSSRQAGRVLYITYDGLADPLGRSQILPYLVMLSAMGHEISVLSCEKPALLHRDGMAIESICRTANIDWRRLRFHERRPILGGALLSQRLKREAMRWHEARRFDLVHSRSYLAAAAGLALKRRFGVPFLFDMRGFWPDERMEAGSWPRSSSLYRMIHAYMRRLETRLLEGADHIISLTHAAETRLRAMAGPAGRSTPITVIPCCADFEHFKLIGHEARAAGRRKLRIPREAKVLAHLGSVTAYMVAEVLDFFRVYASRNPGAILLFVTQECGETIFSEAAARGVDANLLRVRAASREEVPELMAAADAGIFFVRPVPSAAARSPVRMGEMMAMGLPIVTNAGIGDVQGILEECGCGAVVEGFSEPSYHAALARLERQDATPAEIRARGRLRYDLAEGSRRYDHVYRALLGVSSDATPAAPVGRPGAASRGLPPSADAIGGACAAS